MDCIDLTIDDSESERPQSFPKSSSRSPINIDSETETEDDSDVEFVSYGPGSGIRTPSTTRKNLLLEANLDNRKKRPRSRSGTRSASPLHGVTSSMSLVCLDSPPRTLTKPIRKFTTNATGDNNRFSTPCKAGPSRIGSSSMDMDTVKGDDADRDLAVVPTPGRLVNKKKVIHTVISGGGTLEEGTPEASSLQSSKSTLFIGDFESESESEESDIEILEPTPSLIDISNSRRNEKRPIRVKPLGSRTLAGGYDVNDDFDVTTPRPNRSLSITTSRKRAQRSNEAGPSNYVDAATAAAISEDERFARELQTQERKEYQDLIAGIVNKKEGIVFRTVINVADGTLEDGSPAHPDDLERFEPWKNLFESTSIGQKVKRFHWIVNYELEKRFEEAKEALQAIPGMDAPSKELLLFHGTNPANINSILDNGFRIGGVGGQPVVNGTAMGYGVYLATHSATSVGYALGGDRIFACRVFPGKITGDYRYSQSPPKTTNPLDEPYHTYMQGGVYVVRYAALLVPCYMIEFERPQYQNPYGNWGMPVLGAGAIGFGGLGAMGMGMGTVARAPAPTPVRKPATRRAPTRKTTAAPKPKTKAVTKTRSTRSKAAAGAAAAIGTGSETGAGTGRGKGKGKASAKADVLGLGAPVVGPSKRTRSRNVVGTGT